MEKFEIFIDQSLSTMRNKELNEYRKTGQFSDLTLQTTDKQMMRVHKNVLSAACPYFRAMLKPDFIESQKAIIQLSDEITKDDLEIILEYLYTGTVKILTNNARNLFIKAQFFNLVELKNFCAKMLIKSLKIDNALELWRFSEKYKEDSLGKECLKFCTQNAEEFLKMCVFQITYWELKSIISADNLQINQEYLYTILIDWCKHDFHTREKYLENFIAVLDFSKMSNEFIESVVLSDSELYDNRYLSNKMAKLAFTRLHENKKKNQSIQQNYTPTNANKINLNLITNKGIHELNWELKEWMEVLSFNNKKGWGFSTSTIHTDIYIAGGLESRTKFESYQRSLKTISDCPPMLQNRYFQRSIQFNGKIYCCGGCYKKDSTEVFDFGNSTWMDGSKKAPTNSFGITTVGPSIYTLGGWMNDQKRSTIVEHYDSRMDKWTIISDDNKEKVDDNKEKLDDEKKDDSTHLTASIHVNNSIYCFSSINEGSIFDIRKNKWRGNTSAVMEPKTDLSYFYFCYDVTELYGEVYGVFQTVNDQTWGTFKYDRVENRWIDLEIPIQLDSYADVHLCAFDNNLNY